MRHKQICILLAKEVIEMTNPIVITRQDAHRNGEVFYFTGKPCKSGHISHRYVSNGCCKVCVNGMFKKARNGLTSDLVTFQPSKLWAPAAMQRDDLIRLRHYLQTCIFAYIAKNGFETPAMAIAVKWHAEHPPAVDDPREIP